MLGIYLQNSVYVTALTQRYFNYVSFQENIKELVLSAVRVCFLLNLQLERECCGILSIVWKLILSLSMDLSLKIL